MKRLATRLWRVCVNLLPGHGRSRPLDRDTVVLVHGLGRTPASMVVLRTRLKRAGFRVVNFGYPSTSEEIEVLVDRLEGEVATFREDAEGVLHFVTHSMGGVLVRSYLEREPGELSGRVVMLGPPSQGSEIIDAFADSRLLRAVVGPAGARLGTDSRGIAQQLGPIDFSLGIIAGDKSINPIGSWLFGGPNDGKVSVARAQLDGAADFLVLPATHTFIMNRGDVAEQVVHFLKEGAFRKTGCTGGAPMPTEDQTPAGAESELRETDLHDATATLDRKRIQIVRLSAIAFLVLLWVGLEATPLGAMLLAVLSIVPLKRAVKEYLALSAQRVQLIGGLGSERDDEPGAGTA